MGLFSWCTSDTQKSISVEMNGYNGCPKKVYLLNPWNENEPYVEMNYDGYGHFGGRDIYALVAKWNYPDKCKDEEGNWLSDDDCRDIGIDIACYDFDHVKLKYPIKIVENCCAYEEANISPSCPYRGYFYDEELPKIEIAFASLQKEIEDQNKIISVLDQHDLNRDNRFKYQMLSRMQSDCEYYLGYGGRGTNQLWAHDEKDHIVIMKALYLSFSSEDKPEWISMEDIKKYERDMMPDHEVKKNIEKRREKDEGFIVR